MVNYRDMLASEPMLTLYLKELLNVPRGVRKESFSFTVTERNKIVDEWTNFNSEEVDDFIAWLEANPTANLVNSINFTIFPLEDLFRVILERIHPPASSPLLARDIRTFEQAKRFYEQEVFNLCLKGTVEIADMANTKHILFDAIKTFTQESISYLTRKPLPDWFTFAPLGNEPKFDANLIDPSTSGIVVMTFKAPFRLMDESFDQALLHSLAKAKTLITSPLFVAFDVRAFPLEFLNGTGAVFIPAEDIVGTSKLLASLIDNAAPSTLELQSFFASLVASEDIEQMPETFKLKSTVRSAATSLAALNN